MLKKKIQIKGGKVHNVGYRLFLMNSADDFGIENFDAKNVKEGGKQCVRVLVESSPENVNKFFAFVENKENRPTHAKVVSVGAEGYEDYIKPLESFRSGFIAEQQQKFVGAAIGLKTEMHEFRTESGENQKNMLGKQDQMLGKQDQTIEVLGGKIDNLTTETKMEFNTLNIKYGAISLTMNKIFEELIEERKETRKSMEKLIDAVLKSRSKE